MLSGIKLLEELATKPTSQWTRSDYMAWFLDKRQQTRAREEDEERHSKQARREPLTIRSRLLTGNKL